MDEEFARRQWAGGAGGGDQSGYGSSQRREYKGNEGEEGGEWERVGSELFSSLTAVSNNFRIVSCKDAIIITMLGSF